VYLRNILPPNKAEDMNLTDPVFADSGYIDGLGEILDHPAWNRISLNEILTLTVAQELHQDSSHINSLRAHAPNCSLDLNQPLYFHLGQRDCLEAVLNAYS
jgi:hypothetical protein